MEYHDRGTPLVSVQKFFNRNLRYSCKCFWFITFVKKSEPGGLAFSRKHALCQSQSPLWRVSVLLKTAGCGRVSWGSGIRPKYSAGLGKTPELLTGNGICPLLGERDAPLQTLCAYSNSFNSSNAGRFFWSWILKRLYRRLGKEKGSRCILCSRPGQNVKLGSFTLQSCSDGKEMFKRAWCTCKVVVLLI